MISNRETTAHQIKRAGIIAIVRGNFSLDEMLQIGGALLAGGVSIMEVTLNSRDALTAIGALRQRFGTDLLAGAGTVRTVAQLRQAVLAGAQFMISPNFDPLSVTEAQVTDLLHLPGVATATEAQNAFVMGSTMLKLFPADVLGGAAYLKALRAPLDDIDFVPTGGIRAENIAEYVRAGAAAVAVGSSLVSDKNWSVAEITARAKKLCEGWKVAKV